MHTISPYLDEESTFGSPQQWFNLIKIQKSSLDPWGMGTLPSTGPPQPRGPAGRTKGKGFSGTSYFIYNITIINF